MRWTHSTLPLCLAAAACNYDYVVDPADTSSSASTGSSSTGGSTTTAGPGSGGSGAGSEGGGGPGSGGETGTTTSAQGGAGTGGEGGQGTGGEGEGGQGGGGIECLVAGDCPQPEGECEVATCDGVCGFADRPDGTEVGAQTAGDCMVRSCQAGEPAIVPGADPPANTDCTTYSCDGSGQVQPTFVDANVACGQGGADLACDGAGNCVGCTEAADCPAPGNCRAALCNASGVCEDVAGPDGAFDGLAANDCKQRVCDGGVLQTVADGTDLPLADANVCTTAACSGTTPVQSPMNGDYDGNGANDCKERDCVNGVLTTLADASDPPLSDGIACTSETCAGQTPSFPARPAGTVIAGCNGVCQSGSYAGTCGYSLYSRTFPAAGSWTRQALSAVWTGANAPPPTSILTAEETSSGNRLMVIRADGTYYQFSSGAWQAPVPADSVFAFMPTASIASSLSGEFFGNEIIIFTTGENPPRSLSYELVGGGGSFVHTSGPQPIPNEQVDKVNAPPQHDTTIAWAIGEQRGTYPDTEDAHVAWKSLQGLVYENWSGSDPGFYYPFAPAAESTSPFGLNGANNAPAANTAVAAFYRNATNTAYFIAP